MPRQSFRKSGADLRSDRCEKNLLVLGELAEILHSKPRVKSDGLVYHLFLCRLSPLVPVAAFREAFDKVMQEEFPSV